MVTAFMTATVSTTVTAFAVMPASPFRLSGFRRELIYEVPAGNNTSTGRDGETKDACQRANGMRWMVLRDSLVGRAGVAERRYCCWTVCRGREGESVTLMNNLCDGFIVIGSVYHHFRSSWKTPGQLAIIT